MSSFMYLYVFALLLLASRLFLALYSVILFGLHRQTTRRRWTTQQHHHHHIRIHINLSILVLGLYLSILLLAHAHIWLCICWCWLNACNHSVATYAYHLFNKCQYYNIPPKRKERQQQQHHRRKKNWTHCRFIHVPLYDYYIKFRISKLARTSQVIYFLRRTEKKKRKYEQPKQRQ